MKRGSSLTSYNSIFGVNKEQLTEITTLVHKMTWEYVLIVFGVMFETIKEVCYTDK